jgi:hypothetical protein
METISSIIHTINKLTKSNQTIKGKKMLPFNPDPQPVAASPDQVVERSIGGIKLNRNEWLELGRKTRVFPGYGGF